MIKRTEFYLTTILLTLLIIGTNIYTTIYVPTPVLPVAKSTLTTLDNALADFVNQIAANEANISWNSNELSYIRQRLEAIQTLVVEVNRKLDEQ
jgi:PhoPQ-activated pathogenicity-related protein